jgi:hypothetical protein
MLNRASIPQIEAADRPFGCPLDHTLDIPVPLSVNRTRRENKARQAGHR